MADRRAREVAVSSSDAADETEHTGTTHPESATFRVSPAPADATLHAILDRHRSEIVERFVRAVRHENVGPETPRAAVIDDLSFFLADLADALRGSLPPATDRARRHGNRRHLLGFDLGAVLREYSLVRTCILSVARDAGLTPSPSEVALLDQTIDAAMADAALAYASDRDAEVAAEREALEKERARLARAVASRDDVLAIVSHDLRNPLTSISLGVDQIRRHSDDGTRRERILDSIERSVQRMTSLIEDLLAIAKIDAGQLSLTQSDVPASTLIDDAAAVVRPVAEAKSIELHATVPAELVLCCDRDRLLQVLLNLVGNALKFTPESGTITIDVREEGEMACFAVADTGPGIPPDSLPYVFDRFYQGPGRRRGGAGLGLAIARAIVEAHGGRIVVDGAVGSGTTIRFTVPLAARARQSTV